MFFFFPRRHGTRHLFLAPSHTLHLLLIVSSARLVSYPAPLFFACAFLAIRVAIRDKSELAHYCLHSTVYCHLSFLKSLRVQPTSPSTPVATCVSTTSNSRAIFFCSLVPFRTYRACSSGAVLTFSRNAVFMRVCLHACIQTGAR